MPSASRPVDLSAAGVGRPPVPGAPLPAVLLRAARDVTAFLHRALPLSTWVLARVAGEEWEVAVVAGEQPSRLQPGDAWPWADTLCAQMVAGAPRLAPWVADVPALAETRLARELPVGAYLGVPIGNPQGVVVATLAGLHPLPLPQLREGSALEIVEAQARLLGMLLASELAGATALDRAESAEEDASRDALTGCYNRRAWERFLTREDERSRRYDHPAAVLVVDLDKLKTVNDQDGHQAGDQLLRRAAQTLREAVRTSDIVARLGGDEFAVLAVETEPAEATRLTIRVAEALGEAGVAASVGVASRGPSQDLNAAWQAADRLMYESKRSRRAGRPLP